MRNYPINATQLSEALKTLEEKRPFTSAHFSFNYKLKKTGQKIKMSRTQVYVKNEVWMPVWTPPSVASKVGWDSVLAPLRKHEQFHVQLNRKAARRLEKEASLLLFDIDQDDDTLEHIHQKIQSWFQKKILEIRNNHQRFDINNSKTLSLSQD